MPHRLSRRVKDQEALSQLVDPDAPSHCEDGSEHILLELSSGVTCTKCDFWRP